MADIHIEKAHQLGIAKARQAVENIAREMAQRFEIDYWWEQNTLHFHRHGVSGRMEVEDSVVRILVRLGFLMRPFSQRIRREIDDHLQGLFGHA